MNQSPAPARTENATIPFPVRFATALLWGAWALSLVLSVYNHFLLQANGFSPGLAALAPVVGLTVQAIAIYFIARGSNVARIIAVIFLVLATPGFYLVMRFIANMSLLSVCLSIVGFGLRVAGIGLLFSSTARPWFKQLPVVPSGT